MKKLMCLFLVICMLFAGCANTAQGSQDAEFDAQYPTVSETEPKGTEEEILAYRRDLVEAEMRRMMSILWTPAEDITYSFLNSSAGIEEDEKTNPEYVVKLYAGRIYQGIPYAHGSSAGFSFLDYATGVDENGVYTISGMGTEDLTGYGGSKKNQCARMGTDCADTVFWAWAQVSTSISFIGTKYMTVPYGCIKVGNYEFSGDAYNGDSTDICDANGEQVMFASYAQMQKGDAMVMTVEGSSGHAIMNVSVHVERDAAGNIDGEKSYAIIIDQSSNDERKENTYYNEEIGKKVYVLQKLDKKRSFNKLFKQGYMPVTCKELLSAEALPQVQVKDTVSEPTQQNMFTGIVSSNYRIASVTITITDAQGNAVQTATAYGQQDEMYKFSLVRFRSPLEQTVMQGKIDLNELEKGAYHCTYTCRVATGKTVEFRSFDFEITK